ncbi:MAG TPA: IMP cyclohydrolase, partial [Clostridiales bacterium]|nr:IMP cyclohydrolase [Clostridiales bacterium]
MEKLKLKDLLPQNPYWGRGIILGLSEDRAYAVCAYFIMGRSVNSRNRIFVAEGDNIN